MTTVYRTPFCSRTKVDVHTRPDDFGKYFVDIGVLVLSDDCRELRIYEEAEWDEMKDYASPVLTVHLVPWLVSVKFKKFRSAQSSYRGGRLTLTGVFDRSIYERITFLLQQQEFNTLRHKIKEGMYPMSQP